MPATDASPRSSPLGLSAREHRVARGGHCQPHESAGETGLPQRQIQISVCSSVGNSTGTPALRTVDQQRLPKAPPNQKPRSTPPQGPRGFSAGFVPMFLNPRAGRRAGRRRGVDVRRVRVVPLSVGSVPTSGELRVRFPVATSSAGWCAPRSPGSSVAGTATACTAGRRPFVRWPRRPRRRAGGMIRSAGCGPCR